MIRFFLSLALCLSPLSAHKSKTTIVTSFSILSDMTSVLCKSIDDIDIKTIVDVGQDPHAYDPTPQDSITIQKADLLIINGLNFESWLDRILENTHYRGPKIVATRGVERKSISVSDNNSFIDPHAWMNPLNAKIYINNIMRALVTLMPQHLKRISENARIYIDKLDRLNREIKNRLSDLRPHQRVFVTNHDAFGYFCDQYDVKIITLLDASNTGDVSCKKFASLTKEIKQKGIKTLFLESAAADHMINNLSQETSVRVSEKVLYTDSLSERGSEADTYLKMIKYNVDALIDSMRDIQND